MKTCLFSISAFLILMALLMLLVPSGTPAHAAQPQSASSVQPASIPDHARVAAALQSVPVMFIENVGQFDAGARFQVRGGNGTIYLAHDAIWFTLLEKPKADISQRQQPPTPERFNQPRGDTLRQGVNLKLSFVGANVHAQLEPFNRLDTHVSYMIGNDPKKWHPDAPAWGGVRYKDLYPGIDWEIIGEKGQMVQHLVARQGADLHAVRLRVEGADKVVLEGQQLKLTTAVGEYLMPLLQLTGAGNVELPRPTLAGNQVNAPFARLEAGKQSSVTSDASDLLYSTFLGGSADDEGLGIAADSSGAAYVTGYTRSFDFPTTPGAFDTTLNGVEDAFVVKLNGAGSALTYATFLGGSDDDSGYGIAVDSNGAAYVTGYTLSFDFPTTPRAFDTSYNGGFLGDAFVVKLDGAGSALTYATFLGGSSADPGSGIAIDSSGAAYVTGYTLSSDFPTTPGAFDTSYYGIYYGDAFVVKLNAAGSALTYATFLGGGDADYGAGIAIDSNGAAFVTGGTASYDFPTTPGAFDTSYNGDYYGDAFVVKLDGAGSALTYATFLGGSSADYGNGIAIDSSGAAYVTGGTSSSDFPTTPGAFDTSFNGAPYDAFVVKLNGAGSALTYATFLGGSSDDYGSGIAIDSSGPAYITGETYSPNFPTTPGAFDRSYNGGSFHGNAFVGKLNAVGSALTYGTFLGGSSDDFGRGIAVDSSGAAYVTGWTNSSDFPTTPGAFDTSCNGGCGDAFAVKLAIQTIVAENDDPSIQYNCWRGVIDAKAKGGTYRVSNVKNDNVTFKFKGSSIKWVTYKGPDQGKALVTIDGGNKPVVDLYSATLRWNATQTYSGLANTNHTITIEVLGAKNKRSTGFNVVVDAFVVGATTTQENSCSIKYNTWTCLANTSASAGSYRYNGTKGGMASLTFNGMSLDWITAVGPNMGNAQVLIDGTVVDTPDLYAPTQQWQVVRTYGNLSAGQHTIQIKVLGTKNKLSKGKTVVVDAFSGPITTTGTSVQVEPQPEDNSSGDSSWLFWTLPLGIASLGMVRRRS